MIPQFVISLLYTFVLVSTNDHEVETSAVRNIASETIATVLGPKYIITNDKRKLSDEKVTIQLYYETHCGYCVHFISPSFRNTVVELRSYLDVNLYPYGNARVLQNGSIACQHGPTECYGNMLHACAIDFFEDIILAVIFNSCMMEGDHNRSDDAAADACGTYLGLDSGPIKQCAKGPKGEELLKFYGKESKKVHYEGVPTVLINGKTGNTDDFRTDVCRSYKVPPKPCKR